MKRILVFMFVWAAFHANGQLQFGSLQELFSYADQHAVAIQTAMRQQEIAAVKRNGSKTALLPSVNGSAGFNDNITLQPTLVPANLFNPAAPEGTFSELTFGRKYMYSAGIQVSWDVLNFQKWFDARVAEAALALSETGVRQARNQLYNQLAQTYYSILLTQKYREISGNNLAAADSIHAIAKNNYEQGLFSEENLNRNLIQKIQAQQEVNGVEASLEQLYNQLQLQINASETILLTETITENDLNIALAGDVFSPHPDVSMQEAQVKLSRQQWIQAKMLLCPSISIGYQYNYNWATDRMTDLSEANELPQQFLAIRVSVPVFNGFGSRSLVSQSAVQLQSQQMILENKKLLGQKEDENLRIRYRAGMDNLHTASEILELQYRNDAHSNDRYLSGIAGPDERLDAFQDLLRAQQQYMQCLSDLYISYYALYIREHF